MIDLARAQEFHRLAVERAGAGALREMAEALAARSSRFREAFGAPEGCTGPAVRRALEESFAGRRRARQIAADGAEALAGEVRRLLHGDGVPSERVNAFCRALGGGVPAQVAGELAAEFLHYTFPERYWLWGRWIYAPADQSGALVVLGANPGGGEPGAVYMRVGEEVAHLARLGGQLGIAGAGPEPFVLDAYLALVYALYVQMVTGVRTTPEFAGILPPAGELARRLLGLRPAGARGRAKEGEGFDEQGEGH